VYIVTIQLVYIEFNWNIPPVIIPKLISGFLLLEYFKLPCSVYPVQNHIFSTSQFKTFGASVFLG